MKEITKSQYLYVNAIEILSSEKDKVRAADLSRFMEISKPSVGRAIVRLEADNYIEQDTSCLALSAKGKKIVAKVRERQVVLLEYLEMTTEGVDGKLLNEDALNMVFALCDETYKGIEKFIAEVHKAEE